MAEQKVVYEISVYSVLKVLLVLVGLWFVFAIRDILAIVFTSIIIAATLSPIIDYLAKKGIPRALTIVLSYFGIMAGLGLLVYFILPPAIGQLKQLAEQLPTYFEYLNRFISNIRDLGVQAHLLEGGSNLDSFSNFLNNFTSNIFDTTRGFISGFTALLTVLVLTLYLLLDEDGIKKFFTALLPLKQKDKLVSIGHQVGHALGAWLRGQLLLAVIIGFIVFIGLTILQVPYALTLGLLAGVFEIIPVIGPILSAIPAIAIALAVSPTMALIVTIFYLLVQEAENKLLVPKVMQRTVGLHPVTIIIILLIGAKLMGVLGILLAVPVASVIYIILREWSASAPKPKIKLLTK